MNWRKGSFSSLIIEHIPDAIVVVDRKGIVKFLNPAAECLFNRGAKEMVGNMLGFPIYSNKPQELNIVRYREDSRVAEMHNVEIEIEGETFYIISLRDITEAEEELEQSVSLLRATLESTADGILVFNREGKISFNQKFVDMWRIPISVIGSGDDNQVLSFILDQVKDPEGFFKKLENKYLNPNVESHDTLELKDGKIFEHYSKPQKIRGKSVGMVWSFIDITKLKRAEERSVRQEKLAAMGALASIIGHEVRGPLSVIKNSAEFLKIKLGKNLDEKVKRHLNILQQEVNASDKIIDDILGFARVKELALTIVDVDSIVEATIKRLTIPTNVKIVPKFGTDLPQVTVDISQIEQVFLNIITNAIEAMSKGGTLTIVTREQGAENKGQEVVEISFQDTGPGIPKENLGKIFEPLFTTKSKGTGLGLATCQNIIRAHNGMIEVESEVDKGTTVTVKLPIPGTRNKKG